MTMSTRYVIGASLLRADTRYIEPRSVHSDYDRALVAAYVAVTGRIPLTRFDHERELVDQFTYRGKGSTRGKRILEACRG